MKTDLPNPAGLVYTKNWKLKITGILKKTKKSACIG